MNSQPGLSFEQAPPFHQPLRFFLTAPLFLLVAGVLLAMESGGLNSRWSAGALALTHALTLGFLAMVMLGALMQILPVVAGSTLPASRTVAMVSHAALTLGTTFLMTGFLRSSPVALGSGIVLLLTGFMVFIAAATISLMRVAGSDTVRGMRHALASLALTVLLGGLLALIRAGWENPPMIEGASTAHAGFGLLGWILLLVAGVAYQVVPMFQITPPYPLLLRRWLTGVLFVLLLLRALVPLHAAPAVFVIDACLAAGMLMFAFVTLRLQSQRRRKLPDITLDYWRTGMTSLIACVAVWLPAQCWPAWAKSDARPLLLGVLFLYGFAASVVTGMLYKIVPFLAWFHLQAQHQAKAGTIPNMKQMITERKMRLQFRVHLAALLLLVAAVAWPNVLHIHAGIAVALSSLLLLSNMFAALRLYLKHGGRMS
ncbi:MAG: hypothetical protein HXY27_08755 [Hydrogenophilaceae bacterium]|nr:hypothetical protein [Hydrogenophilaceae bacterium]